jgi:hypothetical protein
MTRLILKTSVTFFLAYALITVGCNKVKELLDIKFDADFTINLPVNADDSGLGFGYFNVEETVDPLSDEEVQKYIDNIKSWEIIDLKIKFNQVNPDFDMTEGIVKIYLDEKEVSWLLEDQQIIVGSEFALGNEDNQWSMVNEIINQKKPFKIKLTGKATPASNFNLQLIVNSKITANPL